jgi:transcription-repair coupling factor (superfamily II helicase)
VDTPETSALGWDAATRAALAAAALRPGPTRFQQPPGAAGAWLVWTLHVSTGRPVLAVLDGPNTLEIFREDLAALTGPDAAARIAVFPAADLARAGEAERTSYKLRRDPSGVDLADAGDRLDTLRRCRSPDPPGVIVTCVPALLQPTWSPDALARARRTLHPGGAETPQALAAWLEAAGYALTPHIQARGEAAVRGGLVDVWPPHEDAPVRVEFWDDAIESLRRFDPWTQLSRPDAVPAVELTPARDRPDAETATPASLIDHLPPAALRLWVDPSELEHHAELHAAAAGGAAGGRAGEPAWAALRARAAARPGGADLELWPEDEAPDAPFLGARPAPALPSPGGRETIAPDVLAATRADLVRTAVAGARAEHPVRFCFSAAGALDRFRELYLPGPPPPHVLFSLGALSEGFMLGADDGPGLTVIGEGDLYGRRAATRRYGRSGRGEAARAPEAGERILDAGAIEPGEWVVHADHGIGRFLGLVTIEERGVLREVLAVEYAERAKLYIPAGQAHLLSRYIGAGRGRPEPHRLGGGRWAKEKDAARRAVQDLAGQLLETQAVREARPGHACRPDTPWQHELEAAFPFVETPDQARAIEDVKRDMERARPMDRLICGDVGFGKTEVALRAAFKTVMDGRQAAVLVPTTVLAQQQYDTFCARLAAFPVTVALLSRFRSRAEQQETIERLRAGAVDIVIGTHRLVQPDVAFRDLGLVVIDEEQRFGVAHKEALKRLRSTVDVLTLTATPIPRTLHLSLTGARDLSVLQTPPQDRRAVETIVRPYDDALVREAILRELNREGQVFYLHNRVQTIANTLDRLRRIVPEARIELAHGQMAEGLLERVMQRFVEGAFDVLLCTTIIESGMDIPRVNTILIERADRFGLADLYQLRGRVGRRHHQAYAYLLLPKHGRLFDTARQRVGALRKYGGLGAGFKVALRDLETRGAGNLLGAEQSGHIAAVGFDLYCQLLRRAVAALKGEALPRPAEAKLVLPFLDDPGGSDTRAALPESYIEDETHRLEIYRRLSGALTAAELDALARELRDRFGRRPPETDRLLAVARLRLAARDARVDMIEVESDGQRVRLRRGADYLMPDGRHPRLTARDPDARLRELRRLLERLAGKQ